MKTREAINSITHGNIFLFAKETHADVVPQQGALRHRTRRHSVLVHGHIKVSVGLHHTACSQDGLGTKTVIRGILQEDAPFETPYGER